MDFLYYGEDRKKRITFNLEDIITGQKDMKVFLVDYCRFNRVAKDMNLYLVKNTMFRKYGEDDKAYNPAELNKELFILQSFAYINGDKEIIPWIHKFKGFLLDSGAFTIFSQKSNKMNFEEYLNKYIKFINDYDVKQFGETSQAVIKETADTLERFKVDFKNNAAEAVGNLESMFEVMAKNTDKQQDKAVKTLAAQLAKITGQMVDNYNALMSRIAELDKLVGKNGGRG